MPYQYESERRVEFHETDTAGIVHFSNFFRYMESTEHAFLRDLGIEVHRNAQEDEGMHGWARVHASCDYRAPLRYPERFLVRLLVREKRRSTLTYAFTFHRVDGADAEPIATGRLTVVCVGREPGEQSLRAKPMPDDVASLVEVAPPELPEPENS